jgi:hypothetical protein
MASKMLKNLHASNRLSQRLPLYGTEDRHATYDRGEIGSITLAEMVVWNSV